VGFFGSADCFVAAFVVVGFWCGNRCFGGSGSDLRSLQWGFGYW
jgi:hypothetical protein